MKINFCDMDWCRVSEHREELILNKKWTVGEVIASGDNGFLSSVRLPGLSQKWQCFDPLDDDEEKFDSMDKAKKNVIRQVNFWFASCLK